MAAKSYVFKEQDLIKPPVNIENPNHLKRFLDDLTNKLNANSFFTYPIVNGYTGTLPINYLSYVGREVNGMLEAAAKVDALSGTVKNYITENLQTVVLQNAEDLATVTQQFGTFYDDATAAAWYGLTVKTGELISGFTVGGLDTDTTTPGTAGSFFAISADKFTVGRALEDIDDPAELAYAQANNLPYGTMYDADLGQVIPAFLIEWNGTSYDIYFNGKVQFTNVAGTETLLSDVSSALQEAQSKNVVVFYQTTMPTATKINDLWFDTDDNYKMYIWDGTSWVNATQDAATAINTNTTTINGAKITTGSITASQIAANTITASQIATGTITASKIAADTITAAQIAAGTITSSEMSTNVLLVGGQIKSSNYSWGAGTPVGFGLWAAGDPDSGQLYNIIGGKIYGGQITGTTINASTINIRNLNLVNDAGYAVDPFFTVPPAVTISGTDPKVYDFLTDMYTYNSLNASSKRTVGTTGTKVFFSELDTTGLWAPTGYLAIAASDYSMTFDVDIMVGTTTLATRTTFSTNTDYNIGGFIFRYHYDTAQTYNYTFCIKAASEDITLSSTSTSPITIRVSINWSTSLVFRKLGFAMLVSNL